MKTCGRCGKTIKPGQKYTEHHIDTASGPGATVYRHKELCSRPPTQTTQSPIWR